MENVKRIRTEADYESALARIDELMDAPAGTPEGEELDVLADLVEHYESKNVPMGFPTPVGAIEFRMEQAGLTPRDLIPFIGSRSKVSEVLSGKRQLTMPMARALHEHLGIPGEVLLSNRAVALDDPLAHIEWNRFPLKAMAKLGWLPDAKNLKVSAEAFMTSLIDKAGGRDVAVAALYRKNDHVRANANADPYALKAWCWKVLADANEARPPVTYRPGIVTLNFLRQVARLSWSDEGPRLAREYLIKNGIALITLPHLPKTHLDGAALKLADGTPVIGLTLRYDRVDNFWFCLLHELAHIGRHMDDGGDTSFVDDLTLRDVEGERRNVKEIEADEWAEEASVPREVWENSEAKWNRTPMAVVNLAKALQVHPAIIAGKIRHEEQNFRLLTHFVGTGGVREQLLKNDKSKAPAG